MMVSAGLFSADRFIIGLSGNFLLHRGNEEGREICNFIYPEIKLGYSLSEGFYNWLGYGYMSGTNAYWWGKYYFTQHILSAGIGYKIKLNQGKSFMLEVGASYFHLKMIYRYEEYIGGEIYSPSLAPRLNGILILTEDKRFLGGIGLGYMGTSTFNYKILSLQTTQNDGLIGMPTQYPTKFGGIQFGLFFGYRL